MSCQAVLVVQATGAVGTKLLGQVEDGVWQPLPQGSCVLLSIVPVQVPWELLIVINGLIQLLYWGSWGSRVAVFHGDPWAAAWILLGWVPPTLGTGQELIPAGRLLVPAGPPKPRARDTAAFWTMLKLIPKQSRSPLPPRPEGAHQ